MTTDPRRELYEKTLAMLKPVFERVVTDPAFRERLEQAPLAVMDEIGVELDPQTREELQGKRFSEFWSARRQTVEGPVQIRDLPPEESTVLNEQDLEVVVGGLMLGVLGKGPIPTFAPPYVPVGPVVGGDNLSIYNSTYDPTKLG